MDQIKKDEKVIAIFQGAIKEAVRILSTNPPGNLDDYNDGMIWALAGSMQDPTKWEKYLIGKGMEIAGITSLKD